MQYALTEFVARGDAMLVWITDSSCRLFIVELKLKSNRFIQGIQK